MSHFKVLVIGENVEEQLAPYDENLEVEPYIDPNWNFDVEIADAREWYSENPDSAVDLEDVDSILYHYTDGADIRAENGKRVRYTTYNPDSKWDYWTVGGRYNATFRIKPDADPEDYAPSTYHWSENYGTPSDHDHASDCAIKRAIDFSAMVKVARQRAEADWEKYLEATEGLPAHTLTWAEFSPQFNSVAEARAAYNTPWLAAVRGLGWFYDPVETLFLKADDPKAAYVANAEVLAVSGFYAVVQDGQWEARGDMGWFGFSDGKVDGTAWRLCVADRIHSLSEDTRLTVVDCHI